jgi:hypothetical protein
MAGFSELERQCSILKSRVRVLRGAVAREGRGRCTVGRKGEGGGGWRGGPPGPGVILKIRY